MKAGTVLEMSSGSGHWTFMLQMMGANVSAVGNMQAGVEDGVD